MRNAMFCFLLTTVFLSGCGRKGPLIPPEALVPAPVTNLQVIQRGDAFRVSWSAPTREVSKRPLQGGLRFLLYRHTVLPPKEDCTVCPDAWKLLGEIDPAVPGSVEKNGNLLTYIDQDLLPERAYQYRVQAVDVSGGISRAVTLPPRQRVTPPFPPVLQVAPGTTGVHLEFVAPTTASRETSVSYLLFRREGESPVRQLTVSPLPVVTFEDTTVRLGATYRYTARTVATIAGQTVESNDSNEAVITVTLPD